jgi:hypothetical protein
VASEGDVVLAVAVEIPCGEEVAFAGIRRETCAWTAYALPAVGSKPPLPSVR